MPLSVTPRLSLAELQLFHPFFTIPQSLASVFPTPITHIKKEKFVLSRTYYRVFADSGFRCPCSPLNAEEAGNRWDQLFPSFEFLNEGAIGEQATEYGRFFWGVMAANENDLGLRSVLAYLVGCFDAVHFRHHDIQHNHVWSDFADSF